MRGTYARAHASTPRPSVDGAKLLQRFKTMIYTTHNFSGVASNRKHPQGFPRPVMVRIPAPLSARFYLCLGLRPVLLIVQEATLCFFRAWFFRGLFLCRAMHTRARKCIIATGHRGSE